MGRKIKKVETRQERYKRTHPWVRLVEWARRRCKDERSKWFPYYGAKGITCDLTAKQLEQVWIQCGADKLRRPSLDRIDSSGNYTVGNVRIIEWKDNARMALDDSFAFLFNSQDDMPPLPEMEQEAAA